ncbi:MAG: sodium:solute symporter family protein [Micavibrio aeruginosavorus]|uniref:Sodium:solute symporter family protein n=1 Tax=Micavibrio aeruginosavorus TaxID=349221 RepID=A0A7T5R4J1_9BACT|nr:MAG: sodium:solute symporter family protein [Micavibrio aeruginosavorus]
MLFWFVIAYWVVSVLIGLWAGSKVHNTRDFAIAGRHLPFYMVVATVFATWFGSESVLGIPATFLGEGIGGIIADPFGASLCLILFGLFLAGPLYKMNLLTIGDFYKKRYGRTAEVMTTLAIVISYLGWVGAQITALGLVFNIVSGGEISQFWGMWIGSLTILIYTFFGGMWAVAITDLLQMVIIVLGMVYIGGEVAEMVPGGVMGVVDHAVAAGKFSNFWPSMDLVGIIAFAAALMTMMFGSMPQQDVFQRAQSAKKLEYAKWGSVLGGSLYFFFTFIPMFLAYSAFLIAPDMVATHMAEDGDPQMILPSLILEKAPLIAQIIFFGALLSAIKSCASATLLAPSVTFTENILRPLHPGISDRNLLKAMRWVTMIFTLLVTLYAINSDASIFEMVENAYQITLATAFVPLVFGIFWRKATNQGALAAIFCGLFVWVGCLIFAPADSVLPPQFAGLLASFAGMMVGSLMPQFVRNDPTVFDRLKSGQMAEVIPETEQPDALSGKV